MSDDPTLTLTDTRAPEAPPAATWRLVLAWVRGAPQRAGESAYLRGTSTLGRAVGPESLRFQQERPGRRVPTGPLDLPALSREQLRLQVASAGVQITNVGRRPLKVNGRPTDQATLGHHDVVEIERLLVALVVRRAPWPALDGASTDFAFGTADADGFVGESRAAWALRAQIPWCARRDAHVLLSGPSGAGKELAARALHRHSSRAEGPFVARNATTLPESLLDAELFGHAADYPQRGMPARAGLVGAADGGSLFLDEISELPVDAQAHLLRLMDGDAEYHRLGETHPRRADLRLIGATNRDPATLRHDLGPRFLLQIDLPSLDERREDIPLLIRHLARRLVSEDAALAERHGDAVPVEPAFVTAMLQHTFTHQIRELERYMWSALSEDRSRIRLTEAVAAQLRRSAPPTERPAPTESEVREALEAHGGNRTHAAAALGISRYALLRLLKRMEL